MGLSSVKHMRVISEDGDRIITISAKDFNQLKSLMIQGEEDGEYPKEVNTILDKYKPMEFDGTISTEGDGWGWIEQ